MQRYAETIRSRLRDAAGGLPPDERGVLPGLVDGDTSLVEPDLADAFEKAGLTHLMAVSGENLSLIVGMVLALGRFAGAGRRAGPLVAGAVILGFVVVARPSPSVLRATVMGAVALVAVVTGRERAGVPVLCAAVLVLVLADPELARSYGFALSALATAGILVLAPPWRSRLDRGRRTAWPVTSPSRSRSPPRPRWPAPRYSPCSVPGSAWSRFPPTCSPRRRSVPRRCSASPRRRSRHCP